MKVNITVSKGNLFSEDNYNEQESATKYASILKEMVEKALANSLQGISFTVNCKVSSLIGEMETSIEPEKGENFDTNEFILELVSDVDNYVYIELFDKWATE